MILVTAAFGHQGKLLVPKLAAAGYRVRALRATPGKEDELLSLGAHEVVSGDVSDPAIYAAAMKGVDAVYHVGPGAHPREREMGVALIEAARRMGVRHVVMSSVLHPIIDILQHRIKRDIEEQLIESGLHFTILKPCDFMMPDQYSLPVFERGILPVFWPMKPGRRGSLIDLGDLTDVAVRVLREGEAHYYASYELAGPDKLTPQDIATIFSRVTGKSIKAVEWTAEDMLEQMFGSRQPGEEFRHQIEVIRSVASWYSRFEFIGNPNILTWLLGRPPTSFEQFAKAQFTEYRQRSGEAV